MGYHTVMTDSLRERLRKDVERIRGENDRTGPIAQKTIRWEGCPPNPNGWRLMGDLANDIEELLNEE